jgi:hypothetical protein
MSFEIWEALLSYDEDMWEDIFGPFPEPQVVDEEVAA